MPDHTQPPAKAQGFATRLSHAGRPGTRVHGFVNPPLVRGSTVLNVSCEAAAPLRRNGWRSRWCMAPSATPRTTRWRT